MPGFGRSDGKGNRFQVAHFADHDHVRVFPESSTQCRSERLCVREHFALANVAIFRGNDVFDRVLERDDVIVPLRIYLLDHCRQCR